MTDADREGGTPLKNLCSTLNRFRPAVPLVLRVILGGLFVWHGVDKFDAGLDMVEMMFESWGVPAPGAAAGFTAVAEIMGGAMLIVGAGTRLAALVLSVIMIGAIAYVKQDLGLISSAPMPGAELDLALLAGLVALLFQGPGALSVDARLGLESAD